ncbi:MAG TPA: hypothetical protein VIW27_11250 [Gammaproteobacteria bacterium]
MNSCRNFKYAALVLAALLLGACATTRPVHEWRNDGFSGTLDSVLIIAAIKRSTQRRVYEDLFAETLSTRGVTATPGYTLMTSELEISRDTVEAAIRGRDIDAVLVTRLLGIDEFETYHPPPSRVYYRSYYSYYDHALTEVGPGYYRRYKVLTIETALYDSASGELVWSMQSEAVEPSTPRPVIEDQINLTIERLAAQGLVP